jgi:hypothetical protein
MISASCTAISTFVRVLFALHRKFIQLSLDEYLFHDDQVENSVAAKHHLLRI